MKLDSHLILALDVVEEKRALKIVGEVRELVDAIKVNWPIILGVGPGIITKLAKESDVLCDFKIADIPNTNRLIVQEAFRRGASGVIVHGFPGEDSVKACVDAAKGDVFVVTEMSHPGAERFNAPIAEDIAKMAVKAGATGIIAPATRPDRVRRMREIVGSLKIATPGVGAQGGSAADAIRAGADYVIVGRAIYEAKEPRKETEQIIAGIRKVSHPPDG
jgi:orotidine-5'-phosphate decarboxylase